MDFISGALPNVMFIAGLIAIGLALGLEFKIVEVKGDLSKQGRIGAFSIGIMLIIISIVLYLRPVLSPATGSTPTQAPATFTPLPPTAVLPASVVTDAPPAPNQAATSIPADPAYC